ncbi:LOW QUALITY PROTEIN: hypothetical protein HID58_095414, partial [Brassica napus]
LIHRDSPHSPLLHPQPPLTDRLHSSFLRSISRSHRFNNHPQTDLQSGLIGAGGEFFMSITIGTPPINVLAIADTGSDLTWVQCTVSTITVQSSTVNNSSSTKASLATHVTDNALSTTERGCDEAKGVCKLACFFPGTVFGCGYNNGGNFDETGSGIIGLGGGNLSLISHARSTMNGTSVINLGTSSILPVQVMFPTWYQLLDKEPQTYYYLTLEAISVGNTKIPYTSSMYYPNDDGVSSAATKGKHHHRLRNYTDATRVWFLRQVAGGGESVTGAKRVSDLKGFCRISGSAEIGFAGDNGAFSGADVRLSALNAFVKMSEDMVCLSMIPTNEVLFMGTLLRWIFFLGMTGDEKV